MTFIATGQPCFDCGSSDALAIDNEGKSYCFSCRRLKRTVDAVPTTKAIPATSTLLDRYRAADSRSLPSRGTVKASLDRYGVRIDKDGNIYFPYGDGAVKCRDPGKGFTIGGDWKSAPPLFGMGSFPPGSARAITITEGEIDALSAYQIGGSYPVVSIRNGAGSAAKDCAAAYDYLDSFEDIVVCFDSDEPGRKAAKEVADLFAHKARVFVHEDGYKDANEYLTQGAEALYKKLWWSAQRYRPDGIISAGDLLDAIKVPIKRSPLSYPFDGVNKLTYGIRYSELVTICAGSGLGKTTVLREIIDHVLVSGTDKLGLMFLEETPERTQRGLVGLAINRPIHLPEVEYSAGDVDKAYTSRDYASRVYYWDHFGSNSIDAVLGRMRYLVKACDVRVIVLDHLSMLVSDQAQTDERKAIDEAMTKLRVFVQETDTALLLVSHLRRPEGRSLEDGATTSLSMLRGSAAIAQLSDIVIGAERNSQAECLQERNTTHLRVLKNRYSGQTGPAGSVVYDKITGRLMELLI